MSNRLFSTVKLRKPKRSLFDLSHEKKLSFNMGDLVPIMCQEVVPGDTFRSNSEIFIRMAPMVAPVMHRIDVYTHFFFVPNRLVWSGWEDFITMSNSGTLNPSASVFPHFPVNTTYADKMGSGSLADYLGLPQVQPSITPDGSVHLSWLPFRAYAKIWNDYYRDQNMTEPLDMNIGSLTLPQDISLLELRKRCWERDYFTSALPWAQKGGEVSIPSGGIVELGDPPYAPMPNQGLGGQFLNPSGSDHSLFNNYYSPIGLPVTQTSTAAGMEPVIPDPSGNYVVGGSGITINELRKANKLQQWLERNAIGGTRYIEQIMAHFGVRSSDARLQRPEYLGGGKSPVVISEVLQTSETQNTPQGNMSGHGISVGNTNSFKKYFEEHGYVIGIMSVIPRTSYMEGIPRHFTKFDKFDYYWPTFAHLGEQEVKNKEVFSFYADSSIMPPDGPFGYQSRYAEYKFGLSTVHGEMRNSLSYWHMSRRFFDPTDQSLPLLNESFVTANPTNRIFAVTDPQYHKLYCQIFHNLQAIRPMPKYGTPIF